MDSPHGQCRRASTIPRKYCNFAPLHAPGQSSRAHCFSEENKPALRKITDRLIKEPLVPLGCALTVAAFTNAYIAMRKGDHARVQRMFRARVAAQAFTVIAMVAGGWYFADERHRQRELWKLEKEREAEEKRQKWIRELELRDEEDKAVREMLKRKRARRDDAGKVESMVAAAKGKKVGGEKGDEGGAASAGDRQSLDPVVEEEKSGNTSVFGAVQRLLGGGKGGASAQEKANATPMEDTQAAAGVSAATKK
jgi:uncharacterized ParB-like nuclease family protein